ncbi:MAG: DNA polymerase IV [Euryarchaeota archaeon]|nr:DNA polymerase IV [Euryarchaeota archaeon]
MEMFPLLLSIEMFCSEEFLCYRSIESNMGERILVHCDLDAFFASVETLHHNLDPEKPLIIGSDPKGGNGRGIVSTCNYAAREFGVRSAMPISEAWRRCPGDPIGEAIYLRGARRLYRRASNRVMSILSENADLFEQASIDEAYLDVTERCNGNWELAETLCRELQKRILTDISLSASFGIGPTRVIAKMASEARKPGGIFLVTPGGIRDFLGPHKCRDVPGIGPKAAQSLGELGIMVLNDAYEEGQDLLSEALGARRSTSLWSILEGESSDEISTLRSRKSIGKETTFSIDTKDIDLVFSTLSTLVDAITGRLKKDDITSRSVEVKIRYKGFETVSHTRTLAVSMDDTETFQRVAGNLLAEIYDTNRPVRLVGVRLGELEAPPNRQSKLTSFIEHDWSN